MGVRMDVPFAIVPVWVIEKVSPGALQLYAILAGKHTRQGRGTPTYQEMADDLHISRRSCMRYMAELQGTGAVRTEHRKDKVGDSTSNEYVVVTHLPGGGEQTDTTPEHAGGVQADTTGGVTADTEGSSREQLPIEPEKELATSSQARATDPIWDTLEELFGPAPARRGFRGAWNAAAAELRAQNATPSELRAWVYHWRGTEKDWAVCTPMALAKHWHRVGAGTRKGVTAQEIRYSALQDTLNGEDEGPKSIGELLQRDMDELHALEREVEREAERGEAPGSASPRGLPSRGPAERNGRPVRHGASDA